MKDKQTTPCPTCGSPCTISWSGLDMVENSGDETLATKNYHPLPSYEEIEREQLEQQNRELKEKLRDVMQRLDDKFGHGEAQYNAPMLELICDIQAVLNNL